MISHLLLSLFLSMVTPVSVSALDFVDVTDRYRDAPFSAADTAGISVLTSLGVVEGNPDGTFAPGRGLNRAEFLKIVVGSIGVPLEPVTDPCFPDVEKDAWYAAYICHAKQEGIVSGYPDGMFRPNQSVNYAEALKMLGEIYTVYDRTADDADWYAPYRDAAYEEGVGLPRMEAQMARLLTRGQMARLAAAYIAHSEGQLDAYRAFEEGRSIGASSASSSSSSTSSSSSPSSVVSVSSVSSVSSDSSVASASSLPPSVSHFLFLGRRSPVLLDGVFLQSDQDGEAIEATVTFARKLLSPDALVLVDGADRVLATLKRRTSGTEEEQDKEWRGTIAEGALLLRKGEPVRLGVRADLRTAENGAAANEMIEAKKFELRVVSKTNGVTTFPLAEDTHFPVHQTALGSVTAMENVLATSMSMQQGTKKTLASFTVSATGSSVRLQGFTFQLDARDVAVTNVWIGGATESQQTNCGLASQGTQVLISCPSLPEAFRVLNSGSLTLSLYGDLALTGSASAGFVQLRSLGHGTVTSEGVVRWTDGVGEYSWMEADTPVEDGPMLTVTK